MTIPGLPAIPPDAHKYSRGSLLVLGGSTRFPGAAILAAQAGSLTGAGYVTLAVPASVVAIAQAHLLSIPVVGASETGGAFAADALADILEQVRHIDAVVFGCGLTVTSFTTAFTRSVQAWANQTGTPLLLDADALHADALYADALCADALCAEVLPAANQQATGYNLSTLHADVPPANSRPLTSQPLTSQLSTNQPLTCRPPSSQQPTSPLSPPRPVLTPHAGEIARLFSATATDSAEALARHLNAIVVAKGPVTTITDGARVVCCDEGTPALAKAGTGDVLSGIIGALLAQGMDPFEAAWAGVVLHARAGCLAEKAFGTRSVMAEHLLEAIPVILRDE